MSEVVLEERRGPALWITMNRPDKLNALSGELVEALRASFRRAAADDEVKVVVLTGAGRAFSAGFDISEESASEIAGADRWHDLLATDVSLGMELWSLPRPTIAAVRGWCLAGACELAMACDMIVAADDAVFGTPEINVGLWPFMITVPLLRSMPPKTALDLMMTGRRVSAEEGSRIGFVQRVVPVSELDATVDALAADLAAKSPLIMHWGRDAFYRVLEMDADAALSYLQGMLTVTTQTEDAAEGVAAFAEKRAPVWKGR